MDSPQGLPLSDFIRLMDSLQSSSTELDEFDSRIAILQLWFSSNAYSHQGCLMVLSGALVKRYNLSKQPEDIDKAILHLTEAVLLPLPPVVDLDVCACGVNCFFQLARLLIARFHLTSQPEDLKYSIDYFRHLYHSDLHLDPVVPRSQLILEFAKALGTNVKLEAGSAAVTRTIEEMVALCRELLTSDIPGDDLVGAIVILKDSFDTAFDSGHVEATNQVVEYIREAIPRCPPGSHTASNALAQILAVRSMTNSSIGDSQEAIALFDKIATSQPLGDKTNPSRSDALLHAATVAYGQFSLYPNLENLEEVMSRVRTAVAESFLEDNPNLTLFLEELMKAHAEYFHPTEHPQMVSSGPAQEAAPSPESPLQHMSTPDEGSIGWDATRDIWKACSMTAIERQIELLVSSAVPGTADHRKYAEGLTYDFRWIMDSPPGSSTSLDEFDSRIATLQLWLSSGPYSLRHMNLAWLSYERFKRYNLSKQPEDIDKAILHLTEAVLLPLPPLVDSDVCTWIFFQLARLLFTRFHLTSQPEDLKYSVDYFRHLYHSDLRLDPFDVPRSQIIFEFVMALSTHVQLEAGSATVTRTIEEMVALCRKLLNSNISGDQLVDAIVILSNSLGTAFESDSGYLEAIDQVVGYIREAIPRCPPGSHTASNALAEILATRSLLNYSIGDSQEAIALFDKITASQPLGDKTNPSRSDALLWAAKVTNGQFILYPNLENLEEAISRARTARADSPLEDNPQPTQHLKELIKTRAKYLHLMEHPQMVNSGPAQEAAHSSLQHMSTPDEGSVGWDAARDVREACSMTTIERQIQLLRGLISSTLLGTADHGKYLEPLANWYQTKFERTDDTTYLEKCIRWRKIALASTPNDVFICPRLIHLASNLHQAYRRNHSISFLEDSISLLRHVLTLPGTQGRIHTLSLRALHQGLHDRFLLLRHREDLDEAVLLLQMSIGNIYTIPPDKLQDACTWVAVARACNHPSVSTAYETAMSWMQTSLVFAPTLHTQHAHLLAIGEANKIPLEYASYQVQTGRLEEAIQTLERGRALLWSEMRGLRTSIDELSSAHPALATKLMRINQDLETLMMSIPPGSTGDIDEDGAPDKAETDAFSNFLKKQRMLLNERDALTCQIQGLPGFENFLKMPSFDMLRAAASRGPVIVVNHCSLRSDMILVLHDSPPSLIPTAEDFYHRANELANQLSDTRKKHRLDSMQYDRVLRYVLEKLYELVGQPVMDKLHELNIPEQSRIWWCPTSVFSSLPLHAMGPIPSKVNPKVKRYFSDVYISSYTPTLSALIKSREPSVQTSDPLSLLIIAPPATSLVGVGKEIEVIRCTLESSIDIGVLDATPKITTESLRHHRLAHFACHGVLKEGKPFEASFILYGGKHLTLLDIVRSRLPTAEFAFLSACHTAELTDGSIADEALHLTAAMQHCGFRSVVGTMWAMADTDGRDMAEHFYKSMFSGGDQSIPYYERSAEALRDAVQKLRREKRVSLERWVNFVHYGA